MKNNQDASFEGLPWYRYPMVWMIILLPAIVVVASIYTIVIAHRSAPQIISVLESKHTASEAHIQPDFSQAETERL